QCRATFNNQKKQIHEQAITETNRLLRRNRSILKTLSPEGKSTVRKDVLDTMGYDYGVFSGLFRTKSNLYYLVYDYAFSPIFERGIEKALIVQRQDYMSKLTLDIWRKSK
ncbi:MAG: hypothetical protein AAFY41_17930, partial [Bacteroidota bacterium]